MGSVLLVAIVLATVVTWLPAKVVAPASRGPHITDLNILLPPRSTNPVQYRLQGSDGCFKWSWDHHDILSVQPEYNASSRCSTSARLKSIAPYNGRRETSVYATDLISGKTIRCKVFIDNISRIQIFHHAVKIDLDELAVLQIRAFDEEDNVFSSLVGLQFSWQLVSKSSKGENINHLVHVPLHETPLSDCGGFCGDLETQIEIEDKGLGSDLHVVKGIEIGQEIVTAKLFESELEQIGDTIILTVAEAMSLDPPSPVFVTIDSVINFKLRIIRLNTPHVIELPSPHHKWHVSNDTVAKIDNSHGKVHALSLGYSDIIVEDIRVSGHVQSSALHVVIPSEIILYLLPVLNASNLLEGEEPILPSSVPWYLFPGQEYILFVKAFSEGFETNQIYLTERNKVKVESSTLHYWDMYNYKDVYPISNDIHDVHDWHNSRLLRPIYQGKGFLTASITYQRGITEPNEVLKLVHEVNVCDKVQLFFEEQTEYSKNILLPWAPGTFQEIKLTPIGGCGKSLSDYKWFSSNEGIISISSSGIAYAKKPGQTKVKAISIFDPLNFDEVVIEVSIPSSMVFVPIYPVETVVGTQLQVAVSLKSSEGNHYARCEAFNSIINWRINSETESFKIIENSKSKDISILKEKKHGSHCAWVYLLASTSGKATISATLSHESRSYSDASESGPAVLKAVTTISSFYPLAVHQAGNGNRFGGYSVNLSSIQSGILESDKKGLDELYLVVGSSMDMVLFGGPERWSQRVDFVDNFDILDLSDGMVLDSVTVKELSRRVYRVSCQTKGSFKLQFSRGNLVGDDHPLPAVSSIDLVVFCDVPSSIILIANEPENTFDVIEATSKAERNSERIQKNPIVVSNGENIRLSAVSLHSSGRVFANSSSLSLNWDLIGCDKLAFWDNAEKFTWERFLILQNSTGQCTIRASVLGFLRGKANSLLTRTEKDRLSDGIKLQIVSSLRVIPESALLVYEPEAKISLSVSGGTCFLDVSTNDTQVVRIIQHPRGIHCTDLVLGARGLGIAEVAVRDIGLSPPALAFSTVKVANVDWIKIISPEQISIMEGTQKDFEILAGTLDGDTFDFSQYVYMDIKVHTDGEVLDLVNMGNSVNNRAYKFSVKAVNLGVVSLYVSARQKVGTRVISKHVKVEVYMKLRVHPEYIYLVPGASIVLSVKGGPKLGTYIEYTSMNEKAVKLNDTSGKILANSVGNSTIRAAAYTSTGSFICDAYGSVEVGIPSSMSLSFQSEKLCIGCAMPVFPSFSKGDLFSFYGVCQAYSWIIENEEVLKFETIEEKDNLSNFGKSDSAYMKVLIGRYTGKSEISVSISCDFISSGKSKKRLYNASELVTVIRDPPLALGLSSTWILPPFYTSSNLLPNQNDVTYTMLRPYGRNNNLVNQESISIVGSAVLTGKNGDLGCIRINDHATGREEIAACIRVSKVEQVRIGASKSLSHGSHLSVGGEFELDVKYYDELGYEFTEANGVVPVEIETNYPDMLSILELNDVDGTKTGHKRFNLQTKSTGTALVRISISNNPKKSDYLTVSIGAQIYPRDAVLHIGHYANFTIIGNGFETGQWLSGNESVLSIHKLTGEAHAHGVGTAKVIFKNSNLNLQTEVTVMNVNEIMIDSPVETLSNVPFPLDGYKFRVKFSEPKGRKIEGLSKLVNVPYDCKVEPAFLGYSKPWIDRVTDTSYCLFFPYTPQHLLTFMLDSKLNRENSANKNGFIRVSIIASVHNDPNVKGVGIVPLFGGFSVLENNKLNFSPRFNKTILTITGNTDFELSWKDKNSISIRPLKIDNFGITGQAEYQVEVLANQPFTEKILIILPATGQREEIEVNYETEKVNSNSKKSTISTQLSIFMSCIFLLIITSFIFMKCFDKPERQARVPAHQNNRDIATPSTPIHSPIPFRYSSSTPQTEPFMEYVRRTVDETPFYKKESRRKLADVQRTY